MRLFMKKMLILLFFLSHNVFCKDILQEAIQQADLQKVEAILSSGQVDIKRDKIFYLSLAERKIEEIDRTIYWDNLFPVYHSGYGAMAYLGMILVALGTVSYKESHSYKMAGRSPIAMAAFLSGIAATFLCFLKANSDEIQYKNQVELSLMDAIKIKQSIVNS